jgi:putative transposase
MPDHVHLLLTPAENVTLERSMQFIKGGYSYRVRKERSRTSEIWQRGFADHRIRSEEDFQFHLEYIHKNPVEGRLIERACDYRYCSAFPGFKLDGWPSAAEAGLLLGA